MSDMLPKNSGSGGRWARYNQSSKRVVVDPDVRNLNSFRMSGLELQKSGVDIA